MVWKACITLLVLLASAQPFVLVANAATCNPYTYETAVGVDAYYLYLTSYSPALFLEVWEEANGVPGLQRVNTICSDGTSIPRDTCILHKETFGLVQCLSTYPGTL